MDYLQYLMLFNRFTKDQINDSFKPCYKWITFNTITELVVSSGKEKSFKPCYKWITFNTQTTISIKAKKKKF